MSKKKLTYEELEHRTLDLTKDILDYLGSKLQQDCVPKPSLNSIALKADDLRNDIKTDSEKRVPSFVSEIVDVMNREPFGNELKLSLTKIIKLRYNDAPVDHYLAEDKRESHPSRDWG